MPNGLPELSPALQTLVTVIGGIIIYVVFHWNNTRKTDVSSKDVGLKNFSVIDAEGFKEAAAALRETHRNDRERETMLRDILAEMRRHTEQLDTLNRLKREENEWLEGIDDRIKQAIRRRDIAG